MIVDGRLEPGKRINEVQLAAQLGVSRTPLREALAGLVAERALLTIPRRGFFVQELTAEEVNNVYPMRAILDPEALRLSGIPAEDQLEKLQDINEQLSQTRDVRVAIELDDDWYRTLWANCPNLVLKDLIEHFMRCTRRYELAAMSAPVNVTKSSHSKSEIIELLRAHKLSAACKRVQQSLLDGSKPVLDWLATRSNGSTTSRDQALGNSLRKESG